MDCPLGCLLAAPCRAGVQDARVNNNTGMAVTAAVVASSSRRLLREPWKVMVGDRGSAVWCGGSRWVTGQPRLVTMSVAGLTVGPVHVPSGKNSAVYLPGGSGGIISRLRLEPLRQSGSQFSDRFGQ